MGGSFMFATLSVALEKLAAGAHILITCNELSASARRVESWEAVETTFDDVSLLRPLSLSLQPAQPLVIVFIVRRRSTAAGKTAYTDI